MIDKCIHTCKNRGIRCSASHRGSVAMSKAGEESAKRFLEELRKDPSRLLRIADLPMDERAEAIRALGYDFISRELDDLLCEEFPTIIDEHFATAANLLNIGAGDPRDTIMRKWGRCMN